MDPGANGWDRQACSMDKLLLWSKQAAQISTACLFTMVLLKLFDLIDNLPFYQ